MQNKLRTNRPTEKNRMLNNPNKGHGNDAMTFIRHFIVAFVVLTLILVPTRFMFASVAQMEVFSGEENLMKQMPTLVDENSVYFEAFKDQQRVNVLLVGANQGMTDTLILASYDMKNQHVDLISIPRDTYYPRPGHDSPAAKKINAIYNSDKMLGTATAVSELLLGMPIHYYARVDYQGVGTIVDAMGGVPITIPFHMTYNDPYDDPPLVIDLPEGYQVLDGEHAIQFLRYRHGYPEGDIGRVRAQQEFMKSAFKQMLSLNLPNIAVTITHNVDSDITLGMATKLATKAIGLTGENITAYMLPGIADSIDGASYWIADRTQTEAMLTEILSVKTPSSGTNAE